MSGFFGDGGGGAALFALGTADGFLDSAGVETVIAAISIPANTLGQFSLGQIASNFFMNDGGGGAGSDFTVRLRIGPDLDVPLNNPLIEEFIFTSIPAETYVLNTLSELVIKPANRIRITSQLMLTPNSASYDITAPAFDNIIAQSLSSILQPAFIRANPNIMTVSIEIDSMVGALEINPNSDGQYYGMVTNP